MKVSRSYTLLFVLLLWMMGTAHAQWSHIEIGAGGGFSSPQSRMGNNVDMGWNFDIRGGYRTAAHGSDLSSPGVALDLDFNYNRWNLNTAALTRIGEPDGHTTIWSLSFTPVLHGSPHWHVSPYALAGPGLYYRNLTITRRLSSTPFFATTFTAPISRSRLSRSVCAGNPPPGTTRVLASASTRVGLPCVGSGQCPIAESG